jgi:hypothetical protein
MSACWLRVEYCCISVDIRTYCAALRRGLGIQAPISYIEILEALIGFREVCWHDRAVFHFLTNPEHRLMYVKQVLRSVKLDGHIIVSTFGPEGPEKCSGLDVVRYDVDELHDQFGGEFKLIKSSTEIHQTPFGTDQQFLYCYCRLER